jgi:hypothetical protein
MQHFPSISEDEFHTSCEAFYETTLKGSLRTCSLQITNNSGNLYIKKEYWIGTPNRLNSEAIGNAQQQNGELTDDEDHEVCFMMVLSVQP